MLQALHECSHWAGAKHGLARDAGKCFRDVAYVVEELVAELTSTYLCAELEIPGILRHREYLASWVQILRVDPRVLMNTGARASEAAEYLARLVRHRPDKQMGEAA